MKRKLWTIILSLALMLCLAACGTDSPAADQPAATPSTQPQEEGLAFVFDWEGSGWSEDHSIYTSNADDCAVEMKLRGLEPSADYRVVLLGMDLSGQIFEASYSGDLVQQNGDGTGEYTFYSLVYGDGTYRDLTLAVIGNGEQITHTFTLEQTGGTVSKYSSCILSTPEYYSSNWFLCAGDSALNNEAWTEYHKGTDLSEGKPVRIVVPSADAVYTGAAGGELQFGLFVSQNSSFGIRLENVETGHVMEEWSNWTMEPQYLSTSAECGDTWTPGRYRLTVTQEDQVIDSVEFTMEEDNAFRELLASVRQEVEQRLEGRPVKDVHTYDVSRLSAEQLQAIRKPQSGLWINTSGDSWNIDATVYTSQYGSIDVQLEGLEAGTPYYAAVMGYDITGASFVSMMEIERHSTEHAYAHLPENLTSLPGTYRDLTVAVIGGDESRLLTFDFVYEPEEDRNTDRVNGALLAEGYSYPDGRLIYPDGYGNQDNTPTLISQPKAGDTYYGHSSTVHLGFRVNPEKVEEGSYEVKLTHIESGRVLGQIQRTAQQLQEGNGRYWEGNAFDFKTLGTEGPHRMEVFRDGTLVESVEFSIHWEMDIKSQFRSLLPERSAQTEPVSTVSIAQELKEIEQSLTTVETDAFEGFVRYKYNPKAVGAIPDFAIASPNVKASEVDVDRDDYVHTANWTLRDLYEFEQRNRHHYSSRSILDLPAVNALHGEAWLDMKGLPRTKGMSVQGDGTQYIWMPVYYEDSEGGILNDEIYLFVYILYDGADAPYLNPTGHFNPELYHEHHITRMLITDQNQVRTLLGKLRGSGDFGIPEEPLNTYPTLDSTDYFRQRTGMLWYLANLQNRLQELGYLTQATASDSYDSVTADAVQAFEKAMGLPADGIADNEMQQLLFGRNEQKELLTAWLDAQKGKE